MAFWVHVEKGYTIFIVYFSSFKSLESLESLARLLEKVLKSCETFKIQDFANATQKIKKFLAYTTLVFSLKIMKIFDMISQALFAFELFVTNFTFRRSLLLLP